MWAKVPGGTARPGSQPAAASWYRSASSGSWVSTQRKATRRFATSSQLMLGLGFRFRSTRSRQLSRQPRSPAIVKRVNDEIPAQSDP